MNEGALLAGNYGPPKITYRLYLSDISGNRVDDLSPYVRSASVSLSNFTDSTWQLDLEMQATDKLNPFSDWVKVYATAEAGGFTIEYALGLYRFDTDGAEHLEHSSKWVLTGKSGEWLPLNDSLARYSAPVGTGVLAASRTLLTGMGIPANMIVFPNTDKTLRVPFIMDAVQDSSGAAKLRIINALLAAGGFYALTTTRQGQFTTRPAIDYTLRTPDVTYGPKDDALLVPPISDVPDRERFANKIIAISTNVTDTPPLVSVKENRNPNSPGSIQNFGMVVSPPPITLQNVISQADLDTITLTELQKATSMLRKVRVTTLPDIRRKQQEVYALAGNRQTNGKEPVKGMFGVVGWQLPLTSPPTAMTHEINRIEPL